MSTKRTDIFTHQSDEPIRTMYVDPTKGPSLEDRYHTDPEVRRRVDDFMDRVRADQAYQAQRAAELDALGINPADLG